MNPDISKTNSTSLLNNFNFAKKYTNLHYEKCLLCKIEFTKKDLLDRKVHITSCDHFFHKGCLKKYFVFRSEDLNVCGFCDFRTHYFRERKEIKKNFNENIAQIYNILYPNQEFSLKRKRGDESKGVEVEPISKKQRISNDLEIPQLPIEIWEKIWFDQLNFITPKDLCLSLMRIVRYRTVSSEWNQIFTIEYISSRLKIQLIASNFDLFQMTNLFLENPLMIACGHQQTELVKILLSSCINKEKLLIQTNIDGDTAFHIAVNNRDSSTLDFLLKSAQSVGLELESIIDTDEETIIDQLFRYKEISDLEDCFRVIISLKNDNLEYIEKLFSKAISERNLVVIEFLCDHYLIEHLDKAKVSVICMYQSENRVNALAIPKMEPPLINKLIKCLGEFAFKALSFQATDRYGGVGMTPLHYAVQSNLLPSVQAISEAAGPRALELLEIKLERICFFNDLSRESEVARDLTPLELARRLYRHEIVDYLERKKAELLANSFLN